MFVLFFIVGIFALKRNLGNWVNFTFVGTLCITQCLKAQMTLTFDTPQILFTTIKKC